MNIQDMNLTEQDLELLIKGLTALPNEDVAGIMMEGLLDTVLKEKTDPVDKAIAKREAAEKMRKREIEKAALNEDIIILKAKLIQHKRYLMEMNALGQVQDILTKENNITNDARNKQQSSTGSKC
jgi:Na+-transporting methylmalonyl-CoA/oxaloacetate decarboxylase beta subunit